MKLFFARHGESEANVLGIFSNRPDDRFPLTQKGIAEVQQLAEALANTPIARVYSSPLLRAAQSAGIVAEKLGQEPVITPALREYDTGILEGQLRTDAYDSIYAENERAWFVDQDFDHRIPGGESLRDIENRFVPFIDSLTNQFRDQAVNVLLIGHGGLYRAMFPRILRNFSFETARQLYIKNCEYLVVESDGAGLRCLNWSNATTA